MLQVAAVQAMHCLHTVDAELAVQDIAANHPSRAVRSAAQNPLRAACGVLI
jgi:hypothetical protein